MVVNSPVYPPFYAFVTSAGRTVVESPLTPQYRLDIEDLEARFRELSSKHARVGYLMSSPHNPSGTVHTAEELAEVARAADRYGVRVIVDEIHAPLVLPGATFVPYLSLPEAQSGFSVMSASKAWNLAGLKAALAVPGDAARDDLARMSEEVGHGASHLGVIAHTAAFAEGGQWLDALLAGLDANRWYLSDLLSDQLPEGLLRAGGGYLPGVDRLPRAARLDSPDKQGPGIVSELEGPAKFFLDEARVALSSRARIRFRGQRLCAALEFRDLAGDPAGGGRKTHVRGSQAGEEALPASGLNHDLAWRRSHEADVQSIR